MGRDVSSRTHTQTHTHLGPQAARICPHARWAHNLLLRRSLTFRARADLRHGPPHGGHRDSPCRWVSGGDPAPVTAPRGRQSWLRRVEGSAAAGPRLPPRAAPPPGAAWALGGRGERRRRSCVRRAAWVSPQWQSGGLEGRSRGRRRRRGLRGERSLADPLEWGGDRAAGPPGPAQFGPYHPRGGDVDLAFSAFRPTSALLKASSSVPSFNKRGRAALVSEGSAILFSHPLALQCDRTARPQRQGVGFGVGSLSLSL